MNPPTSDPLLTQILQAEQLLARGDVDTATRLATEILVAVPQVGLALNLLGHCAIRRQNGDAAILLWETATRAAPSIPQPWVSLGEAMFHLKQFDKAFSCFREALTRAPDLHDVRVNLGITLQQLDLHEDAVNELRKALAGNPAHPEAPVALATSLHHLSRTTQAIDVLKAAADRFPGNAKIHSNLGVLYEKSDRLEDAIAAYDRALRLQPDDAQSLFNRGSSLIQLLRIDEARRDWQHAFQLCPPPNDNPNVTNNLAILELLDGNFPLGFELFESRWQLRHKKFPIPAPEWAGQSLDHKHIIFYVEQGLGDMLQFCRYVPHLKRLYPSARISLSTLPVLHDLLRTLPGIESVVEIHPPYPPCDYQLSLLSIPRVLKTTVETIPAQVPYLSPDAAKAAHWKSRLDAVTPPGQRRVGLFWQGTQVDPNRTIKLRDLAALFDVPGLKFVSLQKGPGEEEIPPYADKITPIGHELLTFGDTAGALANLDLVVTIDTSLAHAAGALGRPTWTFLPFRPDWRWLLRRADCPWYPTMRLYRQEARKDWTATIATLAADLRGWASSPG